MYTALPDVVAYDDSGLPTGWAETADEQASLNLLCATNCAMYSDSHGACDGRQATTGGLATSVQDRTRRGAARSTAEYANATMHSDERTGGSSKKSRVRFASQELGQRDHEPRRKAGECKLSTADDSE